MLMPGYMLAPALLRPAGKGKLPPRPSYMVNRRPAVTGHRLPR